MDQLNYYDLENILSKCVAGEIDMHEPIEVTNIVGPSNNDMYYHRDYKTYGDFLYIVPQDLFVIL